ncbi:MAG: SelB C-terminal domain-containing protein, partial [Dehalococcoidales bacterium]|nr:SelB C-terminal domain-containing protein [Dehalococcoidales bacterium]
VSAVTGQGLPELKAAIEKALSAAQPRRDTGRPRLPVDRVFTISGSGTVVTGTLVDGTLTVGQEVEILPPGLRSRVRGLQTHKTPLNTVGPGSRVAVNLVGLSPADLKRGHVLTKPGWLEPSRMLDARLRLLEQPDRVLKHDTEVSLHTGSAEVMARVRLLEKEEARPGETTWVQFILDEPVAVVNGDHYVIRSPMDTLGGGIVVEAHPRQRHRRFRPEIIENLKARGEGRVEETLLAALKTKQPQEVSKLISQSNTGPELARPAIETLTAQGRVVIVGEGENRLLFIDSGWKQLVDNTMALVRDYHRKFPFRPGIPKAEISSKVKLGMHFQGFIQKLCDDGVLADESALVRLPGFQIRLSGEQEARVRTFLHQLAQNPFSPSTEVFLEPDLLNLLVDKGEVVKTAAGVVFSAQAIQEMTGRVLAYIKQNGKITLGETRDMFQNSRKYAQALLDYMDERKLTRRVGDDRVAGPG